MKLAKALKIKSRITGRIAELGTSIVANNSTIVGQGDNNRPDVKKLVEQRNGLIDDLVRLKTAIALANQDIFDKIERMAQLKSVISFYTGLPTTHGLQADPNARYNAAALSQVQYNAVIRKADVDVAKAAAQKEIEALQDVIDEYNAITEVNVNLATFTE